MRDLLNQLQRVGNDLANLNYQLQLDREALALRDQLGDSGCQKRNGQTALFQRNGARGGVSLAT